MNNGYNFDLIQLELGLFHNYKNWFVLLEQTKKTRMRPLKLLTQLIFFHIIL